MGVKLNKDYMRLAIKEARRNLSQMHGGPFGACVARGNKIISVARNTVLKNDATCHAEVNAIRIASQKLKTYNLSGCVIYSTTEPCPMCFAAIHWARMDKIIYGTGINDVRDRGFNELNISAVRMKKLGKAQVKVVPVFLRPECLNLLKAWDKLENKVLY